MSDAQMKAAIRQHFVDRQRAREAARLGHRQAETEVSIGAISVEDDMTIEEGLASFSSGGERQDAT